MNIEVDESLLEDDDGLESASDMLEENLWIHLDAMRQIERYQELKQLRQLLDDPEFEYDFS